MSSRQIFGGIATLIGGLALALLIMVAIAGEQVSDPILLLITATVCIGALIWGATGAWQPPKLMKAGLLVPGMMLGISALMEASDRYPPLWPYSIGVMSSLIFGILMLAVSWRNIRSARNVIAENPNQLSRGDIYSVLSVGVLVGAMFFQPMLLLANGQNDAREPLSIKAHVTSAYKTKGSHSKDYVDLSGPARKFSSTMTSGEFEVSPWNFHDFHAGERACLMIHSGVLRFDWWSLKPR
ncbi:hypothetical protein GRI58_11615 [Porphyrobacter algicida]|uniref:Uncharacterized protein n=1 Tax=Qipengyuania algicida TaxID=1836209 RepID=A0A845AKT3_9SPHN|nr:hypothetical protein [Qipengyuania algicida]MXP29465.1 hypothetical protein [Qipengyuania algicida]